MNQEKRAIQSSYGSECPVCHGTGWQIYTEHVEGYKEPIEFSKICPKCKGNVGSRTRDRIVKTSIILRMPEEGLREKKAELEQQQFLQMILQK